MVRNQRWFDLRSHLSRLRYPVTLIDDAIKRGANQQIIGLRSVMPVDQTFNPKNPAVYNEVYLILQVVWELWMLSESVVSSIQLLKSLLSKTEHSGWKSDEKLCKCCVHLFIWKDITRRGFRHIFHSYYFSECSSVHSNRAPKHIVFSRNSSTVNSLTSYRFSIELRRIRSYFVRRTQLRNQHLSLCFPAKYDLVLSRGLECVFEIRVGWFLFSGFHFFLIQARIKQMKICT